MDKEAIGLYIESLVAHNEPVPDESNMLEYALTLERLYEHNTPSLTAKEIVRLLKPKGFVLDCSRGNHQIWLHPVINAFYRCHCFPSRWHGAGFQRTW